jgi:hypothetical protein
MEEEVGNKEGKKRKRVVKLEISEEKRLSRQRRKRKV